MSGLNNLHVQLFTAKWLMLTRESWCLDDVQDSFWRYYVNTSEGAWLEFGDKKHPLRCGYAYIIPAGVRFSTATPHSVGQFYVHFDVLGLPAVAIRELIHGPICLPEPPHIRETIREVSGEWVQGRRINLGTECRIHAMIYAGLADYLHSVPPAQLARCLQRAEDLKPVLPAIQHIEEHFAKRIMNDELADLCCVTPDYFIRKFRECTGMTPVQYIQEHRVKIAAQQLLLSDRSIEHIATETGFGNRAYFTRVFTRYTRMSPAAYRKTMRMAHN